MEIGLPDDDSRRRLFDVYARGMPLAVTADDITEVVRRTAGVTASFVKELLRRAVLEALEQGGTPLRQVTPAHLTRALDDLLDST